MLNQALTQFDVTPNHDLDLMQPRTAVYGVSSAAPGPGEETLRKGDRATP